MFHRMPIFDHMGNFNLIHIDENTGQAYERKACLNELDMTSYSYIYGNNTGSRLLDTVYVYADSPDDYYDLMLHCVSPRGIFNHDAPDVSSYLDLMRAKSRFFASLRESRHNDASE